MIRLILAVAAAAVFAAGCSSSPAEEVRSAAQPPDSPGDTAPGQPTTTSEPDPGPTVQQVEIKGRFGEACSDEGLCYEVSKYSKTDAADPEMMMFPGSKPVFENTISFNGETLSETVVMACELGADQHSFGTGGGAVPDDDSHHYRFFGHLPTGTQPLHIDGVTTYQLEVVSPGVGVPSVHIFATDLVDVGHEPDEFVPEFFEVTIASQHQTWDEFQAELGRPVKDHSCTYEDFGLPQEDDTQ